jgi:hypothetical protein
MNAKKRQWRPPLGSGAEGSGASTTQLEHIDGAPYHPWGVWSPSIICKCVVTCMGSIDKSNSAHGSHSPCA